MSTCGRCQHFKTKGSLVPGMGLCAKEPWPYAKARTFSPQARCDKDQFAPIPGDRRK